MHYKDSWCISDVWMWNEIFYSSYFLYRQNVYAKHFILSPTFVLNYSWKNCIDWILNVSLQFVYFAYETNMIILTIYLINETYFLCHFLAYSSQWTQKLACNEIWMLTYTCWTVTCIVLFSIWRRKFYFCHNSHKIRQNWIIHLFKHN